jgi:hypothetical protein
LHLAAQIARCTFELILVDHDILHSMSKTIWCVKRELPVR